MVLVKCDDLVHRFFGCEATSLGLLDFLWVSALLNDEIVYVQHVGDGGVLLQRAIWGRFVLLCVFEDLTHASEIIQPHGGVKN